jgi:hypothetical protein
MPKGSTYTKIPGASITLGSNASSVTFSSIPQTYTDLIIIANVKGTTGGNGTCVQFNGDTGGNYSYTLIDGNGSSATSSGAQNQGNIQSALVDNVDWGVQIIQIMNYSNTTTYKNVLGRGNDTLQLRATSGLWKPTTGSATQAITSITVLSSPNAYNFITGSTFNLYGIAAA